MTDYPLIYHPADGKAPKVLTQDELETLAQDGFVKPKFRLSNADLEEARAMVKALIANNPHVSGVPLTHMHAPGYSKQNLKHGDEFFAS
jgi:hypothetical protein